MRLIDIVRLRLRSLWRRDAVEQELDEELRYHLDREMERHLAAGLTQAEAQRIVQRSAAGIEQRKEECRDVRGVSFIDNTVQDLRYAVRQFRKSPVFTFTAVFVLTLGIASATAIFTFVDAALIRPLPYRDQDRIAGVFEYSTGYSRSIVSYRNFADWRRFTNVFSDMSAFAMNGSFTLTTPTGAEQVPGTRVSSGFFRTLGVVPALGRDFLVTEDSDAAPRTAIISYPAWQKRFGGRREVIGEVVTLNGNPTTIVGVLPPGFQFAPYGGGEFWSNLRGSEGCEKERGCRNLTIVARLADGVSFDKAGAQMQSLVRALAKQYPGDNGDTQGATLIPMRDLVVGDVRPILLMLFAGAGLLLVVACANVSTLLLSRSDTRRREFAVRTALGASSARLFRQFAAEGILLAVLGCGLGLLLAQAGIRLLPHLVPADRLASMPFLLDLHLGSRPVLFAAGIGVVAGIVFALIPIARTIVSGMMEDLKDGSRGSAGTAWRRLGSHLVVVEIAVALVLMVGAGLLGKSLYLLLHVETGFDPDHLVRVQTSWRPDTYNTDEQLLQLTDALIARVSAVPGVRSVALSTASPIDSGWGTASFHRAGQPNHGESNEALQRQVTPEYFSTLGARLFAGRYFDEHDDPSKPLVAVVNRTLVKRYFPGQSPLGREIYYDYNPRQRMQIVGVVDDIKEGPLEGANLPAIYVPIRQRPVMWPSVLAKTSAPESQVLPGIVKAIHEMDPFISVSEPQTIADRISLSPAAYLRRSSAFVAAGFAAVAFLLSTIGLYGVVAYSVSQRTREIGVRMALGAERTMVHSLIMGEASRLAALGIAAGLAGSLAASTVLRRVLFGVRSWDLSTISVAIAVLGLASLLASYIPARRASSMNPLEALRSE